MDSVQSSVEEAMKCKDRVMVIDFDSSSCTDSQLDTPSRRTMTKVKFKQPARLRCCKNMQLQNYNDMPVHVHIHVRMLYIPYRYFSILLSDAMCMLDWKNCVLVSCYFTEQYVKLMKRNQNTYYFVTG